MTNNFQIKNLLIRLDLTGKRINDRQFHPLKVAISVIRFDSVEFRRKKKKNKVASNEKKLFTKLRKSLQMEYENIAWVVRCVSCFFFALFRDYLMTLLCFLSQNVGFPFM